MSRSGPPDSKSMFAGGIAGLAIGTVLGLLFGKVGLFMAFGFAAGMIFGPVLVRWRR